MPSGKLTTRSGGVYQNVSALRDVGAGGNYWTKVAYSEISNAHYYHFFSALSFVANYNIRWVAFAVRCLVN